MSQDRAPRHADVEHAAIGAGLLAQLTARQRLVSVWMTAGFSSEEIAEHLGITRQQLSVECTEIARILRR